MPCLAHNPKAGLDMWGRGEEGVGMGEGTRAKRGGTPWEADPILAARLDAIRQLAGGLTHRVAVMDREFNVVYVNEPEVAQCGDSSPEGAATKCYEAFAQREVPCDTCPAMTVFDASAGHPAAGAMEDRGVACGMREAFPMRSQEGAVTSMLVVFHPRPAAERQGSRSQAVPQFALGALLGRSSVMQELFNMMRLVSDSAATVLIHGESGTGKELVAKTIHELSYRRDKPFVVVDCGSLPETLLESELFGHMKGSFTGATSNKRGLFEEADGGTIFLDEIADTTPTFQAKLLRVLQEGEVKRIGSTQPVKIDVRVISATNKDLVDLVRAKTFRQDLYYRLAVLPLYLPPLRDRREDIPLLVEHFVASSCLRHRQPPRGVSPELMQALVEAPWPGNVRELQHYVERAIVTTSGPDLVLHGSLLGQVRKDADLKSVVRDAVGQAERARILDALAKTGGNRLKAAKLLKISRASLYNKIRDYGLK